MIIYVPWVHLWPASDIYAWGEDEVIDSTEDTCEDTEVTCGVVSNDTAQKNILKSVKQQYNSS